MRLDLQSTICSIATGPVGGLRGAIRISGPATRSILTSLFPSNAGQLESCKIASVVPAAFNIEGIGETLIDVFYWPDQRSYTGQPSAELHMLGAPMLLQQVQSTVLERGALLAQPGEFTLRAFLAGRLDLSQCEAVYGVIHASNDRALEVALTQLAGGLSIPLRQVREELIHLLADIEAGLDFVDEDIEFVSSREIVRRLESGKKSISQLLDQMLSRSAQTNVMQIAVVGEPNVGKSSLVNAIVGRDVSIVTDEAGTTRDYVRARCRLGDVTVDFLDTAGTETIEGNSPRDLAQQFTREQMNQADLVWFCVPAGADAESATRQFREEFERIDKPLWLILTKSDCYSQPISTTESLGLDRDLKIEQVLCVSTFLTATIEGLRDTVLQWAHARNEEIGDVVPATAERCREALRRAGEAIENAIDCAESLRGNEVIASEIRLALDEIGVVAGTVVHNDILDALFSRFCIGK